MIRHAVGSNGDAIVALGRLTRNQPVRHIECHLLGIAIGGVAETAPARQFEADEIAARYALPALGADQFARDQGDPAGGALAATVAAAGWVADPLEIAQHRDRRTVGSAQFDNLAETAAVAPGSARNSRRWNNTGATVSVASTGIVRTPDGNAVTSSPSLLGRAPAPPQ